MDEDIFRVEPTGGFRLCLWFKDGTTGEVDLEKIIKFRGIFKPLRDLEFFRQVRVNSEMGCIEWPNGADLDSLVLYAKVTGKPIESFLNLNTKLEKV